MQQDDGTPERERPVSRRGFLLGLLLGAGGVFVSVLGLAGYRMLTPVSDDPLEWQAVGSVDNFSVGETLPVILEPAGGPFLIWVRRTEAGEYIAFSSSCTHLGATVDWWPTEEQFICRVHGGIFDANGDAVAGPVIEPLARFETRVVGVLVEVRSRPEEAGNECAHCALQAVCASGVAHHG